MSAHQWIGAIGGAVGLMAGAGCLVVCWLTNRAAARAERHTQRAMTAAVTAKDAASRAAQHAVRSSQEAADAKQAVAKWQKQRG